MCKTLNDSVQSQPLCVNATSGTSIIEFLSYLIICLLRTFSHCSTSTTAQEGSAAPTLDPERPSVSGTTLTCSTKTREYVSYVTTRSTGVYQTFGDARYSGVYTSML